MKFSAIIKLMEIRTLVAGVIPVILGSVYSWYAFDEINLIYFGLLIIAITFMQSSTNMINDYFDHKRGADGEGKEEEKALVSGEITPKQVIYLIFIYQAIALIIGVFIASQTSYYILFIGAIGGMVSILYAFGPLPISYTPLGEIVAGVTMGIGIATTVIYIHTGIVNLNTVLVAVPTSIFIGTILLSNNLSDIAMDEEAGRKTLPILMGSKNAEKLWVFNVIMLFVLTLLLGMVGIYPKNVLIMMVMLFPYKAIPRFLSYNKSVNTKGKTMELITMVGVKYHWAVISGLLIEILV